MLPAVESHGWVEARNCFGRVRTTARGRDRHVEGCQDGAKVASPIGLIESDINLIDPGVKMSCMRCESRRGCQSPLK